MSLLLNIVFSLWLSWARHTICYFRSRYFLFQNSIPAMFSAPCCHPPPHVEIHLLLAWMLRSSSLGTLSLWLRYSDQGRPATQREREGSGGLAVQATDWLRPCTLPPALWAALWPQGLHRLPADPRECGAHSNTFRKNVRVNVLDIMWIVIGEEVWMLDENMWGVTI